MEKFKGTQGPWVLDKDNEVTSNGFREWTSVRNQSYEDVCALYWHERSEINANLIAAAPDLLEALQDVLYEISTTREVHDGTIRQADAAISRALGKNDGG